MKNKEKLGKEFYESTDKVITIKRQQQGYSEEDMVNFVQFATQYYANDWMENRSIYELLERFKNK